MSCSQKTYNLQTQINVYRATKAEDAMGGRSESWLLLESPWAEVTASGGSESAFVDTRIARHSHKAVVRYTDITTRDKVQLNGIDYNIVSVEDPDLRRRWLVLRLAYGSKP